MGHWTDIAAEADLFEGAGIAVTHAGHEVGLFLVDGRVFAIDNICSHGNARLCDGYIEGWEVECPFHQARFDLKSGLPMCGPATEPVRVWPVKIDGGRVWVDLG